MSNRKILSVIDCLEITRIILVALLIKSVRAERMVFPGIASQIVTTSTFKSIGKGFNTLMTHSLLSSVYVTYTVFL